MKRWGIRILVFLLLGAIVNIAVAWGCAWRLRYRSNVGGEWNDNPLVHEIVTELGWDVEPWMAFPGIAASQAGATERQITMFHPRRGNTPPFGVVPLQSTEAGWPLIAFSGRIVWPYDSYQSWKNNGSVGPLTKSVEWGWAHETTVTRPTFRSRESLLFPLRPIWPGFAINTVSYAVVLWGLFATPFALRRRRRIKRGVCPACGYDLRGRNNSGSVCPECGMGPNT